MSIFVSLALELHRSVAEHLNAGVLGLAYSCKALLPTFSHLDWYWMISLKEKVLEMVKELALDVIFRNFLPVEGPPTPLIATTSHEEPQHPMARFPTFNRLGWRWMQCFLTLEVAPTPMITTTAHEEPNVPWRVFLS